MSRNLEKPTQKPKSKTCQVIKDSAGYFCVRCNWSSDSSASDDWSCCPKCGGQIVPEKRTP
jgi:DNA-directed RNA polymerase subunit RPC12/RpoP